MRFRNIQEKLEKIIVTFVGSCQAQGIRAVRETIGPRKKCILLIPRTSCTSSTLIFNRNTEGKWELCSIIKCLFDFTGYPSNHFSGCRLNWQEFVSTALFFKLIVIFHHHFLLTNVNFKTRDFCLAGVL